MKIKIDIPGYTDIATVDNFNDMYWAMFDGQLINGPMTRDRLLSMIYTLVTEGEYIGHVANDKRLAYRISVIGGQWIE